MKNFPFLVIVTTLSIRGYHFLPMTSGPPDLSKVDLSVSTEDYETFEDPTVPPLPPASTHSGVSQLCDYDPCRERQIPCQELSDSTGCLCPGISLEDERPGSPELLTVTWNGSEVVARWCAPYSHVNAYVLIVGGREEQELGRDRRSGAVGDVSHVTKVCIVARNDAGDSKASCAMYQPGSSSLPLTVGLIGGGLGLLLLLLLVVLLWRRRKQRKMETAVAMSTAKERH